ncbi:MAG: hypothetical protein LBS22_04310 [Puniceicoccales bacterium]|jgi:hypothetical protein|nr:hypothetical protein [Puniceicoccales bacterium]
MASSSTAFPLFGVSEEDDTPTNFLKRARALAKEENVSLPKYLIGMLRHSLRGHDLSKIHFYQDGSGDTYNEDVIDKLVEEAHAESEAGLTTTCNSDEEVVALFEQWKKESDERIRNGNKLPA